MKRIALILILFSMQMPFEAIAQKQLTLHWQLAGQLPSETVGDERTAQEYKGVAGAVIGWHNNMLMVAGGANFPEALPWEGGKKKYHNQIHLFEKKENQFVSLATHDKLSIPVAYAANCITKYGIAAVGGENETGLLADAFLFKLAPEGKTVLIEKLPSLPVPTTSASAVAIDDFIFVIGGETVKGTTAECWKLDLTNLVAGWKKIKALPTALSFAYAGVYEVENNSTIVVLGGRNKTASGTSTFSKAVFSYLPTSDVWIEKRSLPYTISAGTSVSLAYEGILLFGGDRGETFSKVEQLLIAIAKAEGKEKEDLVQQKNQMQINHPGFSKDVLLYHPVSEKVKTIGTIPYPTPVTTTALLLNDCIVLPSGEIRAGVRTPHILMAEIKYKQK
jgi:N-acetylneuraminic acid mutarotase